MSLAEAEYVSLSACYAQVLWLRTQLIDYGFYFDKIPMYYDSKVAIAISCNLIQHSRTRHIDVRYHFIKEQVEKGIVELFFVKTEYQLADMFTIALPEDRFKYLVRRLGSNTLSWKPCQGGSSKLNLPDHKYSTYTVKRSLRNRRYKRQCCGLIPTDFDLLPLAHAQNTKIYYKHQDSRIKKAQVLKTKTSTNSDIKDPSLETKLQGRLLASFQEDAKYEHVGQDTRSQDGKDDQDKQGKDLKISELKTKLKDNDKGSRSKITQHEGTSLQHNKDQRFKNSTTEQSQSVF
ncbi:hypothetical protein Tco_0990499 [Tanacetum coccineum]|uniref:Retrovirus-related Pol polyprotein from transposon TNT 1-94 n=1 Tax=Tanacetum coccineum TaxID=301880 RepID=A0ABQ5EWX8_9ASTR